VGSEGSLVQVTTTVHDTVWAKSLVASKTLLAVLARVVLVSPSDGIALLDALDSRSDLLSYTSTLVSESHIGMSVMLIGTAKTGVGDFDQDLVGADFSGGGVLNDLSLLGTLEDGE